MRKSILSDVLTIAKAVELDLFQFLVTKIIKNVSWHTNVVTRSGIAIFALYLKHVWVYIPLPFKFLISLIYHIDIMPLHTPSNSCRKVKFYHYYTKASSSDTIKNYFDTCSNAQFLPYSYPEITKHVSNCVCYHKHISSSSSDLI